MDKTVLSQFEYEGCTATATIVWQVGEDRYVQSACVGDSLSFLRFNDLFLCEYIERDHVLVETVSVMSYQSVMWLQIPLKKNE